VALTGRVGGFDKESSASKAVGAKELKEYNNSSYNRLFKEKQ
jgi:hypothetical protein